MAIDRLQLSISYQIRKDGFKKLQELSFSFYDTSSVGWLLSRLTSDTNRIGGILSWGLTDAIWGSMVMFFVTISMFMMNWKLALITIELEACLNHHRGFTHPGGRKLLFPDAHFKAISSRTKNEL